MTDTTQQSVKRWQPQTEDAPDTIWMSAVKDGNWVRFDDYAALLTRVEAAGADAAREKMRGDNHWETLRSIRQIARETGDLERIIQWVNDAGQGYMEAAEQTLSQEMDRRMAAEAERDALQAKLVLAVEGLKASEAEIDGYILDEYPFGHPSLDRYRKRDHDANPARIALAQLTADTPPDPRTQGWNAAIEAAARKVEIHNLGRNKDRADRMLASIRAIPCPYTPKEGKDNDQ